jgi:hypothetical protein
LGHRTSSACELFYLSRELQTRDVSA